MLPRHLWRLSVSTARHANHLRPSPAASRTLSTTASSGAPPRSGRSEIDITKDYYDILGVVPDATATEIREAFYDAARRLHPDVNPDPKAKREFELVREAFAVLKKPELRYEYDVKAEVEKSLERRAEEQEEYWMARRGGVTGVPSAGPGGPKKIWSEKLAGDLLRASALRVQKRRGAAAGDARRRRINYLRGNKEEEKKEAEDEVEDPLIPRTLKQQIEWEEGSLSRKFRRFTYATTADTDLGSGGFSRRLVGAAALAAAVIGASFAAQSGAVLPETEEERERRERRKREEEAADRPWRLNMGFKGLDAPPPPEFTPGEAMTENPSPKSEAASSEEVRRLSILDKIRPQKTT